MTGKELLAALKRHQQENPQLLAAEISVWADRPRHVQIIEIAPSFPSAPMTGTLGLQIVAED